MLLTSRRITVSASTYLACTSQLIILRSLGAALSSQLTSGEVTLARLLPLPRCNPLVRVSLLFSSTKHSKTLLRQCAKCERQCQGLLVSCWDKRGFAGGTRRRQKIRLHVFKQRSTTLDRRTEVEMSYLLLF